MKKYQALLKIGSAEGCPFAAAVLCGAEREEEARTGLERLPAILNVEPTDPVALDRCLAEALAEVCPSDVAAAAMTIRAWEYGPVSGGVVGDPHREEESACERLEQLAEDLWSEAFPGGPGFVLCGDRHRALEAEELICARRCCGEDPWPAFAAWAEKRQIPVWLYVADGSGADGLLAVCDQRGLKIARLN